MAFIGFTFCHLRGLSAHEKGGVRAATRASSYDQILFAMEDLREPRFPLRQPRAGRRGFFSAFVFSLSLVMVLGWVKLRKLNT